MTEREQYLYRQLMLQVKFKFEGNADEGDVQRALGALYECWRLTNDR